MGRVLIQEMFQGRGAMSVGDVISMYISEISVGILILYIYSYN